MRNKDGTGGEYPVVKMWYGQKAGHTIEEIIEDNPDYFIWMIETFLDVTPRQADYFKSLYKMELPPYVIRDVPPYQHTKDSPEDEYSKLCRTPGHTH